MVFWEGLFDLLMSREGVIPENGSSLNLLIFASCSAIMGILAVILDWISFTLLGKSLLKLAYGGSKSFRFLVLWGLGAGIGGFLGASFHIFEIHRVACLTAGIGWPFVIPRLVESVRTTRKEEVQKEEEEEIHE